MNDRPYTQGEPTETRLSRVNTMLPIMIVLAIVVVLLTLSLRVVKEYDRGVIFFLAGTRVFAAQV